MVLELVVRIGLHLGAVEGRDVIPARERASRELLLLLLLLRLRNRSREIANVFGHFLADAVVLGVFVLRHLAHEHISVLAEDVVQLPLSLFVELVLHLAELLLHPRLSKVVTAVVVTGLQE